MVGEMIPTNEQETIAIFSQLAGELGYKFIEIGTSCPDAILQKNGQRIRAEFEHKARNFQKHKHPIEAADLIICWEDDWPQSPLPVLSLENYIALTKPMSRWERFWSWWSGLWLTRISYMAGVEEARKKKQAKEFCVVCGSIMTPKCTNSFSEDNELLFTDVDMRCSQCGYRTYRTWSRAVY